MKQVNDYLRAKIFDDLRVVACADLAAFNYWELYRTEWNSEFEELMHNRLIQAVPRYGRMNDPRKSEYNYLKAIRTKLSRYAQTGNDELLVDIANYCMLEFTLGNHPNKHFVATDDVSHAEPKGWR